MDIICTCTSCNAKFKVGEQAAGKKARCPKCQAVITVPAAATATSSSAAASPSAPPPPVSRPAPPVRQPTPVASQPVATSSPAPSGFPITATEPGRTRIERKKKSNLVPIIVGSGAALAVLAVAVGALMFSGGTPDEAVPSKPAATMGTLVIDWPESERGDAALRINGKETDIPPTGPIEVKLPPGRRRVSIARRNYPPLSDDVNIVASQTQTYRPEWKPSDSEAVASTKPADAAKQPMADAPTDFPIGQGIVIRGFEGWLQVLAVAKEKAAAGKKDLLIVLGSSDDDIDTVRLANALREAGLPGGALGERFVPVVIDFPDTSRGGNQVVDELQNIELLKDYSPKQFPLMALADEQGRPYAVQRDWPEGVAKAAEVIERLQPRKAERDELLSATRQGDEAAQLDAAVKFVNWIVENKMLVQYRDSIRNWWGMAQKQDPENAAGKLEVILEAQVACQLRDLPQDLGRVDIVTRLDVLDPWLGQRKFQDDDRAVRLHYLAGRILGPIGEEAAAIAHWERAQGYEPKARETQEIKKQIERALGPNRNVLSNGTGFVVAAGGWVLTNRHVVEGEGLIRVRIPEVKDPVPADLLEVHDDFDMALLKVEFPESFKPTPISLSTSKLNRGMRVAAFGYPLGDVLGEGLKLTEGAVSGLPTEKGDGMMLLDLRVNPGNSGGPLCDIHGNVAGMVTAKIGGLDADSYGMAIPASELIKFLDESLPKDAVRPEARQPGNNPDFGQVDEAVSQSVLMIVKMRAK